MEELRIRDSRATSVGWGTSDREVASSTAPNSGKAADRVLHLGKDDLVFIPPASQETPQFKSGDGHQGEKVFGYIEFLVCYFIIN